MTIRLTELRLRHTQMRLVISASRFSSAITSALTRGTPRVGTGSVAPVSGIWPFSDLGHIFDVKCATVPHRPFRYTARVAPTFLVSRLAVLTLLVSPLGRHWSRPTFRPPLLSATC